LIKRGTAVPKPKCASKFSCAVAKGRGEDILIDFNKFNKNYSRAVGDKQIL